MLHDISDFKEVIKTSTELVTFLKHINSYTLTLMQNL